MFRRPSCKFWWEKWKEKKSANQSDCHSLSLPPSPPLPLPLSLWFTLAGGETGPCCRWGMLLCYKHTTTLDPLVTDDYRFGFICSPLLQKWCYKINSKGSTRTNGVILYSFNVPDYFFWPGQLSFTFSHEIPWDLPQYIVFSVSNEQRLLINSTKQTCFPKKQNSPSSWSPPLEWTVLLTPTVQYITHFDFLLSLQDFIFI